MATEPVVGGDLVLSARTATAEAFAPYGRLVVDGDRARLSAGGSVLAVLDAKEAGPRRVRHLIRYPEARRLVISTGEASLLFVACGAGERPGGPPAAFLVPPSVGVLLDAGVWHAGPIATSDGTVMELLEASGPADRVDRASAAEAFGVEAIRLLLPDEPGAPGPGLDLADEHSVTISRDLAGRVRLGLLAFDRLEVAEGRGSLGDEIETLSAALRRQWGPDVSPNEIPGLKPVRDLYRSLGIDPTKTRPSSEALLRRVLQGKALYRVNALVDAVNLCSLKMLVPFGVYDRSRVAGSVALRLGARGESYEGIGRGRIQVEGRPVLADREGAFGNPTADSLRTSVTPATARALVVLYLPPSLDAAGATKFLEETSATVRRHAEGAEVGRRIVS